MCVERSLAAKLYQAARLLESAGTAALMAVGQGTTKVKMGQSVLFQVTESELDELGPELVALGFADDGKGNHLRVFSHANINSVVLVLEVVPQTEEVKQHDLPETSTGVHNPN